MAFQTNWSASRFLNKGIKTTQMLSIMDKVMPWDKFVEMIESKIINSRQELGGRPRIETEIKLRMYFLSLWFNLSDVATEEAIYDRLSFQCFMNIDVTVDQIPDSTTLGDFRIFLESNGLGKKILEETNKYLDEQGYKMTEGTLIDATIIKAPGSTKNERKERDPEMSSTKKNGTWFFGAKAHIATDTEGKIREVQVTTASPHDSTAYESLINENTTHTVGDAGYSGKPLIELAKSKGIVHTAMKKRKRNQKALSIADRLWNTLITMPRRVVEFPFGVIKNLRGHRKTRYKGLAKLKNQWEFLASLCNIYRMRNKLYDSLVV